MRQRRANAILVDVGVRMLMGLSRVVSHAVVVVVAVVVAIIRDGKFLCT